MTTERWRQVERIYRETVSLSPDERKTLLDRACQGDADLRGEVERMLAAAAPRVAPGSRLGPYEIVSLLGAGGMGEVYKSRDTRLNRTVAIKVLPQDTASDANLRRRLLREAQTASALNHVHIVTIHDVFSDGGRDCIVMEFLEGQTLKDAIGSKGMSLLETLRYGIQIADGLAAAHAVGIIHRDLKPGNIMLTKAGLKILDFGLAKSVTEDETMTASRFVMGTPAYMSPDQLSGKLADQRSDIYSLGLILSEMATGRRARGSPPVESGLPTQFVHVVERCLEEDPENRWQTVRDLEAELEWSLNSAGSSPPKTSAAPRWNVGSWIAAATLVVGALAGGLLVNHFRPTEGREPLRLQIDPPANGEFVSGESGGVAISPDGRMAAYIARVEGKTGLWILTLRDGLARLLPGTQGASQPFWSPNSKSIAYFAKESLMRIDLAGGAPATLCYLGSPRGGAWLTDGRILFSGAPSEVLQVSSSGGVPAPVTKRDAGNGEFGHFWPQRLPEGGFLYSARSNDPQKRGLYAAKLDRPNGRVFLIETDSSGIYAPGEDGKGYLIWARDQTLVAQEFNVESLKLSGEPHPIADPVGTGLFGGIQASASLNGLLVLGGPSGNLNQLTWLDRSGKPAGAVGEPGNPRDFILSEDGQHVVVARAKPGGFDLWVLDAQRDTARRLAFDPGNNIDPLWSPDGRSIIFTRIPDLFRVNANGGAVERLTQSPSNKHPTSWSRDGRNILFYTGNTGTKRDIDFLAVSPTGVIDSQPKPYLHSVFNELNGRFSPETNPKWVAYESDESGRYEVYIQSFPTPGHSIQISKDGGHWAEWRSMRELLYASDRGLMSVDLKPTADSLEPSAPRLLFNLPEGDQRFEVSPDGQRFLVNAPAKTAPKPLTVIVNWATGAQ